MQSVALAILNATDRIANPTKLGIFADPGSEEAGTYDLYPQYREWLAKRGYELITVRLNGPTLREWIEEKSTPIPVFRAPDRVMGHRQCTSQWKIAPITREVHRRGHKHHTLQLGISIDEYYRVKPNRDKRIENRYPLIELSLTRGDCRRIIEDVGLPVPPKSSCWFCPLQSLSRWQWRAIERPVEFEEAAMLEDVIRARNDRVYLSPKLQPLRNLVSGSQLTLDSALGEGLDGEECSGFCFL